MKTLLQSFLGYHDTQSLRKILAIYIRFVPKLAVIPGFEDYLSSLVESCLLCFQNEHHKDAHVDIATLVAEIYCHLKHPQPGQIISARLGDSSWQHGLHGKSDKDKISLIKEALSRLPEVVYFYLYL